MCVINALVTQFNKQTIKQIEMDREPSLRKKHTAKDKKKDKGPIFASQKHVRIELENQWRHAKNVSKE
jgi:hypothetical protein